MNRCRNRGNNITEAFADAPEILFDDLSHIVFMSDLHRGDASGADAFYPHRNIFRTALKYYDTAGFTYVELGDSDELWENRRFDGIGETYSTIFETLGALYKDGRYQAVVGNHDMIKKKQKWVEENMRTGEGEMTELFPGIIFPMGIVFRHREKGWKIHALHGHQADCLNSDLWLLSRFLVRYFWRPLSLVGVKNPMRAATNPKKKMYIANELINWVKRNDSMLIAGHTHRSAFPDPGEPRYFNDGCCVHKEVMTAIEISDGAIAFVQWSIESTDDGILRVVRNVKKGPVPLADYHMPEEAGKDCHHAQAVTEHHA